MSDVTRTIERIARIALTVQSAQALELAALAGEIGAIEQSLQSAADSRLGDTADADTIRAGATLAQAAIEVGPARKALETAAHWQQQSPPGSVLDRIITINRRLASARLFAALKPLSQVGHDDAMPPLPEATAGSAGSDAGAGAGTGPHGAAMASPGGAPLDVLRNIATYHRAHERFYSQNITESAVDLYREANKLLIVADVWLRGRDAATARGVDFSAPQYQAAGCTDLNALDAIPAIGVLFMEGEAEPAEIRVMKAKLQALGGAWANTGRWLSDKMNSAWVREQAVFAPELIDAAQARFNTIATNWRGSRETALAGRLLNLAVAKLQQIGFRPTAVRADPAASGRRLLEAAWIIAIAAQIKARSAAELAENDRNWTHYLERLPVQRTADNPRGG
ncbi:MAG TPA: hypothetical protein VM491_07195 [Burkholderiaceae bacterium]|nr:hypothetical protein [Burkholderiaceae bacterium]